MTNKGWYAIMHKQTTKLCKQMINNKQNYSYSIEISEMNENVSSGLFKVISTKMYLEIIYV